MTLKDLTAYLTPDLVIPLAGKEYRVAPPTKDVGLKLAAINAMGVAIYSTLAQECPACGRSGAPDVPEATRELYDSLSDVDLGELTLGAAYAEMVADGVPSPHIDTAALYALYYWTVGEATADAIMESQAEARKAPKAPTDHRRPSKSGRSTGSASRTRTASTRTTGSRTT